MEKCKQYFSTEPKPSDFYRFRLFQGVGQEQAYADAYGNVPFDSPKEMAVWFFDRGYSIRDISIWVKLYYGLGSKSVVHRWVNPSAYEKHLAQKRKS